eukprot:TRINITY_DN2591_c0_g1_i1.p1 TRINITY_DN2591_c0_g1~~TRINITY_DN2591_c0_g1_i1.p1  ORF type:complete len:260 (+),score=34.58 TRINITY_DN2591_c0_g1_i1:49-828(+)
MSSSAGRNQHYGRPQGGSTLSRKLSGDLGPQPTYEKSSSMGSGLHMESHGGRKSFNSDYNRDRQARLSTGSTKQVETSKVVVSLPQNLKDTLTDISNVGRVDPGTRTILDDTWSFWTNMTTATDFLTSMTKVLVFNTAEDYKTFMACIQDLQDVSLNRTYHLVKDGIKPTADDPRLKGGNRMTFRIPPELGKEKALALGLALIGRSALYDSSMKLCHDADDEVCGLSLTRKDKDIVSVPSLMFNCLEILVILILKDLSS